MDTANDVFGTIERKAGISSSHPVRHTTLRQVAESFSLCNVDQAICELMNEALARLVVLAYEEDAGGLCNTDSVTGKILIPLPWGRNGQAKWGLRPQEANILRQLLFDWHYPGPTLLRYDRSRRAWFLSLQDHPNIHLARRWLPHHQVTISEYRDARAKRVAGV